MEYEGKSIKICRCILVKDRDVDYIATVKCTDDIVNVAEELGISNCAEELLGMFCLNSRGRITSYHEISHGDLTSSTCHPREIFKRACIDNAGSIIIVHNHPSGCTEPSENDISTTKRLVEVGEMIGIPVIDHVILGFDEGYISMKAKGYM